MAATATAASTFGSSLPNQEEVVSILQTTDDLAALKVSQGEQGKDLMVDEINPQGSIEAYNGDVMMKPAKVSVPHTWSIEGANLPDSIEVRSVPTRGDGVFARRPISVLEPVCFMPYPQFMAIETEKLQTTCYSCLVVTSTCVPHLKCGIQDGMTLKSCSRCHRVRFCGKECQARAWQDYHKHECKLFKKYENNFLFPPMMARACMRIVLLQDKGRLAQDYWNTLVKGLVSHEKVWKALPDNNNITDMVKGIKMATKSKMSLEEITRLFWAMKTNCIELPTSVHGGIGMMVDPLFSKFNHACDANAMLYRPWHTSSSGWNLESDSQLTPEQRKTFASVIPLRPISRGEELTISYSDPTMSVDERNAKHKRSYYFNCSCPRCKDDVLAVTRLDPLRPGLTVEYKAWSEKLLQRLEQMDMGVGGHPQLDAVIKALEGGIPKYLDYPELYGASAFDQICLHLGHKSLDRGAFDMALINFLRPYFLIYPIRLKGRHNYFSIHITFVILEIFDIVLGIDCKGSAEDARPGDVKRSLRDLSTRGWSKEILMYWRQRICKDLKARLEGSAAADLLPLVAQIQSRVPLQEGPSVAGSESSAAVVGVEKSVADAAAEKAIRNLLQLSEARWAVVLAETGC